MNEKIFEYAFVAAFLIQVALMGLCLLQALVLMN